MIAPSKNCYFTTLKDVAFVASNCLYKPSQPHNIIVGRTITSNEHYQTQLHVLMVIWICDVSG